MESTTTTAPAMPPSTQQQQKLRRMNLKNVDLNNNNENINENMGKMHLYSNDKAVRFNDNSSSSSTTTTTRAQPFWKSFIYEPNTNIYIIKREHIENFLLHNTHLQIAQQTKCKIDVHHNGDCNNLTNTTVCFTVNGTYEARFKALEELRNLTNCLGVIVNLPVCTTTPSTQTAQMNNNSNKLSGSRQQCKTPTQQKSSYTFDDMQQYNGANNIKRTRSFHNNLTLQLPQAPTTYPIQSSSSTTSMPSSNNYRNKNLMSNMYANFVPRQLATSHVKGNIKHRYSFDFLLERANDGQSKQIPKYWPELNAKYPQICFCGRVISYFDPYKYRAYWKKVIKSNPSLHPITNEDL